MHTWPHFFKQNMHENRELQAWMIGIWQCERGLQPRLNPHGLNLIGGTGGASFGRGAVWWRVTLRDVSKMRGKTTRLQTWIYYTPYALSYSRIHTLTPSPKNQLQCSPDNIWPERPWWIISVRNTADREEEEECGSAMKLGRWCHQFPENSLVWFLPHQSRCPPSWKLQREERNRGSERVCIDVFWRLS